MNQIPIQWQLTTVKSIHKVGVKENIQENQRGIFLLNIVSKIYESALKIKNEKKNHTHVKKVGYKRSIRCHSGVFIVNFEYT